jgi:DNA primase
MQTYRIKDAGGAVVAEHVRVDLPNGKKDVKWKLPGRSAYEGLMGTSTSELPLYGTDLLARLDPGQTVVVAEGEKAAEALWGFGLDAVGTVTGASATPCEDALAALLPFDAVLWPDHDPEGRDHMARLAALLIRLGGACRLLRWKGAVEKGDDAADFADRGGTRSEALDLIARAKRVEAVYIEPRRPAAREMAPSYGESEDRKDRAREELADVVWRRLGAPTRREGRSLFWRCPFHDEQTASFKVDLREPFFRCFGCGARGDVFSFLGQLDGRSFRETLAALAPPTPSDIRTVAVWSV